MDEVFIIAEISKTGDLSADVRTHFAAGEHPAAFLSLASSRGIGHEILKDTNDTVALAVRAKERIAAFVRKWKAIRLLLYYYGPLSGAAFIGHRLNAVCHEVQIMEAQQPGYAPSFLLK